LPLGSTLLNRLGSIVTAQKFGVSRNSADIPTGLMGVGPGYELTGYPIIIDNLASQGITQSRAFSLDLRGVDSPDGKNLVTRGIYLT
jgi:hypothetical protein